MTSADLLAVCTALVSWLMTYAIHSTIVLVAVAVVARRRPDEHAWLDWLWKAALIGPILTASLQAAAGLAPVGGRWTIAGDLTGSIAVPTRPAAPMPVPASSEDGSEPGSARPLAIASPQPDDAGSAAPPDTALRMSEARIAAAHQPDRKITLARSWPLAAAGCWAAIAASLLGGLAARLRRLRRVFDNGSDAPDRVRQVAAAVWPDWPVRLTVDARCAVPLALPGRRVVLPTRALELELDQQRAALAHEIAHVVRRDPAWRIVAGAIERVFFFQPLLRIARVRLCESAEFQCDQWAIERTGTPMALARTLSAVAAWTCVPAALPTGASPMAQHDSPLIRRVTRILDDGPTPWKRPSAALVAAGLTIVTVAAPLVTASAPTRAPAAPERSAGSVAPDADAGVAAGAQAKAAPSSNGPSPQVRRPRVLQPPRPADPLAQRWRWALDEAARQGLNQFWVAYSFETPTHADDLMMSDTRDGSFVNSMKDAVSTGPSLDALLGPTPGGSGNVTALFHCTAPRAGAIDRAGYRSTRLGFAFEAPVFALGLAPERESFERAVELFEQVAQEKIKVLLIELASLHPTTDLVLPFLTRLVDPQHPVAIRREAAEGFDHHHDPRSVEVLLRVARTDPAVEVRAEAAETIGEVQTPESIPALTELATSSHDGVVRGEAAEGFADQPPDRALPALEQLIAASPHDEVLTEAIEALGEIDDARVMPLLTRTAVDHPSQRAQQEAVETIGEVPGSGAAEALVKIVWTHRDVVVQREAVETLGDLSPVPVAELERVLREHPAGEVQREALETLGETSEASVHPAILAAAASGRTPEVRMEALETIADVARELTGDALDTAQRAIERALFSDPDRHVQMEALDAVAALPRERALGALRDVIARHPDEDLRREAREQEEELR